MASGIFDSALHLGPLAISPHFFLESLALWTMYHRSGETETAKGLLIAATVVFLLNAGCWGVVVSLR